MKIYVAGPMRGVADYNFPAFFAAEERFRAAGWDVVNPARMDVEKDGSSPDGRDVKLQDAAVYMLRDLPAVISCDALALLPGWQTSEGANREYDVATWTGKAIYDAATMEPYAEREGSRRYLRLLDGMVKLHRAKAAGYSGGNPDVWANFREAEQWGSTALQGCLIRLGDKYRRCQNLTRNPANDQVGEPLRDTLLDMASYSLIAICLLEEQA